MRLEMNPTKDRDAGLALAFLLLLVWLPLRSPWLVYAAMCALLMTMVWPPLMRPFAWCWFGLALALGKVVSSILLTIVWMALVLPVGLMRRLMGKDPLMLRPWRKDSGSCFIDRNHTYTAEDLKRPY